MATEETGLSILMVGELLTSFTGILSIRHSIVLNSIVLSVSLLCSDRKPPFGLLNGPEFWALALIRPDDVNKLGTGG